MAKWGDIRSGRELENFHNAALVEALHRVRLPTAGFERHYTVTKNEGERASKPDITITNEFVHVISGKFGQKNEPAAYASADEYKELLGVSLPAEGKKLGEVFAVTYPASSSEYHHLHVLPRAGRPKEISLVLKSLDDVARAIKQALAGFVQDLQKQQEPIIEQAPRWLRIGAENLSRTLKGVSLDELEAIFGGHDFFNSLLLPRLSGKQRADALRIGAAYLFINQLLFYLLLAQEAERVGGKWKRKFPLLDPSDYDSPVRLHDEYLERVHDINYEPIYGFDVAQFFLGKTAGEACKTEVRAILGLVPKMDVPDLVGQVFQKLIPFEEIRKPLGANYTNPRAAALLARLAVKSAHDTVFDPACGSGTLLVASYQRKLALSRNETPVRLHKQFVEHEITGIDAMGFSAHLAVVNLALQQPLTETSHVRVGLADSTTKRPDKPRNVILSTEISLPREFKQLRLSDRTDGEWGKSGLKASQRSRIVKASKRPPRPIVLGQVDLVIMNPPFTSWDNMGESYREALKLSLSADSPAYRQALFWKISQQAFFLLLADLFLKRRGRLAAVLPFTTLTGRAFRELTRYLVKEYTIQAIVVGLGRAAFSEDTSLMECLLVAQKMPPPPGHRFALVGTLKEPNAWSDDDVELLAAAIAGGTPIDGLCRLTQPEQASLLPEGATLSGLTSQLQPQFAGALGALSTILQGSKVTLAPFLDIRTRRALKVTRWVLGSEHLDFYGAQLLLASRSKDRALKEVDLLVYEGSEGENLRFGRKDRERPEPILIPRGDTRSSLRRFVRLGSLYIKDRTDFAIVGVSEELVQLMRGHFGPEKTVQLLSRIRQSSTKYVGGRWRHRVEEGSTRLAWGRRFDLAGPGTTVLATWDDEPYFLACDGFMVKGLQPREEKLFALWMNSTPFLAQLLGTQFTSTRGTWTKLEKSMVDRILFPDPQALGDAEWKKVETTFEKLKEMEWPSLMTQLAEHPTRVALDNSMLSLLGVGGGEGKAIRSGTLLVLQALLASMESPRKRHSAPNQTAQPAATIEESMNEPQE